MERVVIPTNFWYINYAGSPECGQYGTFPPKSGSSVYFLDTYPQVSKSLHRSKPAGGLVFSGVRRSSVRKSGVRSSERRAGVRRTCARSPVMKRLVAKGQMSSCVSGGQVFSEVETCFLPWSGPGLSSKLLHLSRLIPHLGIPLHTWLLQGGLIPPHYT